MISTKGKRKIEYGNNIFYWFVRANDKGIMKIHILSEDKKINLEYPLFDSEVPVTPSYISCLSENYFHEHLSKPFAHGKSTRDSRFSGTKKGSPLDYYPFS